MSSAENESLERDRDHRDHRDLVHRHHSIPNGGSPIQMNSSSPSQAPPPPQSVSTQEIYNRIKASSLAYREHTPDDNVNEGNSYENDNENVYGNKNYTQFKSNKIIEETHDFRDENLALKSSSSSVNKDPTTAVVNSSIEDSIERTQNFIKQRLASRASLNNGQEPVKINMVINK